MAIWRGSLTRSRAGAAPTVSIALLVMRRLPEQLLPVLDLCLHGADAVEKRREMRDALRPRGKLEARVVELGDKIVDILGRFLDVLPQRGGGALVRIGDLDRFVQRVGDGLEQGRILL